MEYWLHLAYSGSQCLWTHVLVIAQFTNVQLRLVCSEFGTINTWPLVYKLKTIIAGKATWKPQKLAPCPAERVNKKQTNTASWEKDDVVAAIHATIKVLNVTGLVVPIIYSFN